MLYTADDYYCHSSDTIYEGYIRRLERGYHNVEKSDLDRTIQVMEYEGFSQYGQTENDDLIFVAGKCISRFTGEDLITDIRKRVRGVGGKGKGKQVNN